MKILAAIDGSRESEKVTKALKQFPESDVTVVMNCPKYHKVKYRIEFGNPKVMLAHDMPDHIKADLIVISRTGLNAVERILIGSTANYVATHAKIPVLIV